VFYFYFIVTGSCCGRVPSHCKLSDLCSSGVVSAAIVVARFQFLVQQVQPLFAYYKAHPSCLPKASVLLNPSAVKQVWCIPILFSVQLSTGLCSQALCGIGDPMAGSFGQEVPVFLCVDSGAQLVSCGIASSSAPFHCGADSEGWFCSKQSFAIPSGSGCIGAGAMPSGISFLSCIVGAVPSGTSFLLASLMAFMSIVMTFVLLYPFGLVTSASASILALAFLMVLVLVEAICCNQCHQYSCAARCLVLVPKLELEYNAMCFGLCQADSELCQADPVYPKGFGHQIL
jgi:hypothetical protein